jgi:DNA-binding LacI/PurR family transcriptional regulator
MSLKGLQIVRHALKAEETVSRAEILARTGIPRATATRVLRELVRAGYLERVARGEYRADSSLRQLCGNASAHRAAPVEGGVVFLSIHSWAAERLSQGFNDVLGGYGATCMTHLLSGTFEQTGEAEERAIAGADGLLIYSSNAPPERLQRLLRGDQRPVVHTGFSGFGPWDTVTWDQRDAYARLVEKLAGEGCRAVVYFGYTGTHDVSHEFRQRLMGYREGVDRAGLSRREIVVRGGFLGSADAGPAFSRLLDDCVGARVGIVLARNVPIVKHLLRARLAELGRSQVLLASTELQPDLADHDQPELRLRFRVGEPWVEVGRMAARRLLTRFGGDSSPPIQTLVRAEIDG